MKKFEHIFEVDYKTYLRYQKDKESFFEEIEVPYYLFIESKEETKYKFFLDENVFLKKIEFKNLKELKEFEKNTNIKTFGKRSPKHEYIFQNFFEKSEPSNPRILYLDIEVDSKNGFPYPEKAEEELILIQFFDSFTEKFYCLYHSDQFLDKEIIQSKFKNEIVFKKLKNEKEMLLEFTKILKALNPLIITGWNIFSFDIPYIINRMTNIGLDPRKLSIFNSVIIEKKEYQGQTTFKCEIKGFVLIDMLETYKKFVLEPRDSYSLNNIAKIELGDSKVSYDEFDNLSDLYRKDFTKFVEYGVKDIELLVSLEDKKSIINIQKTISDMMGITLDEALGTVRPWGTYIQNKALEKNLVFPNDFIERIMCFKETEKTYKTDCGEKIKGGYVQEPIPGKYNWVVTFDFSSMYPTNIIAGNISADRKVIEIPSEFEQYLKLFSEDENKVLNISEETWDEIKKLLKKYDYSLSALGVLFQRRQGLIPELIEKGYFRRKEEKKKAQHFKNEVERLKKENGSLEEIYFNQTEYLRYHLLEQALKVLLNSYFGACANSKFILFDNDIAGSITANSRVLLKLTAKRLNEYLQSLSKRYKNYNFFLYSDTDSIFLDLNPIVNDFIKKYGEKTQNEIVDFIDNFCEKKLRKVIDDTIKEFSEKFNLVKPEILFADREKICSSFLIIGKKAYLCDVLDSEGTRYTTPERYMRGITLVKSSTPQFVRKEVSKALDIFLYGTNDELISWLSEIKKKFFQASPLEISKISNLNNLDYNLETGRSESRRDKNGRLLPIPINSRAALSYNLFIEQNNLEREFRKITIGDKIHFLYLKEPNKYKFSVIGFLDPKIFNYFPKDLIDYEKNWNLNFIPNIEILSRPLGWKLEKMSSLDDFFF